MGLPDPQLLKRLKPLKPFEPFKPFKPFEPVYAFRFGFSFSASLL